MVDEPGVPRWVRPLVVLGTVAVTLAVLSLIARGRPVDVVYGHWIFHNGPVAILGLWLGSAVLRRRPGHRGGWLMIGLGVATTLHVVAVAYVDVRFSALGVRTGHPDAVFGPFRPVDLPIDAALVLWISTWVWVPAVISGATLLLLIFPDGFLPSRRWRPAVGVAVASMTVATVAYMIEAWPGATHELLMGAQVSVHPIASALLAVAGIGVLAAAGAAVCSLVIRWNRSDADQRRRMRPVMIAAAAFALAHVVLWPWQWIWIPTSMVTIWIFAGSYAFAAARYRLHDLDVFVSRAAVAAVLAMLFTAAYLGLVVGVGEVVGRGGDSTIVPLVAAGVVAVAFDPVRRRVRRLVERLLWGRPTDPHQVLSELAAGLRSASSPEQVLDDVAGLVVEVTGAERVEIAVDLYGESRPAAGRGTVRRTAPLFTVAVTHEAEHLGAVSVWGRSLSDLAPGSRELVDDLAATLGVVLRNVRLTAELRHQIDELRRSRERLVTVHDEARRELERDLHDGAQAQLIAVRIRLGLAARLAARRPDPELAEALAEIGFELDEAVVALRCLGRGLHPPALDSGGIVAALTAAARSFPLDIVVDGDEIGRYEPTVEAAVYFTCLEAIQNAARHGGAGRVSVRLGDGDGRLRFWVEDDGKGFDPNRVVDRSGLDNIEDRIGSLAGTVSVDACLGRGVTVVGEVPAQPVSRPSAR